MPVKIDWFLLEPKKFKSAYIALQKVDLYKQGLPRFEDNQSWSLRLRYSVLRMKSKPESHIWGTLCCVSAWGVPGSNRDCSVKPSSSLAGKALAQVRLGKSSQLLFAECLSQKCTQLLFILNTFFQRLLIFYIILPAVPCSVEEWEMYSN